MIFLMNIYPTGRKTNILLIVAYFKNKKFNFLVKHKSVLLVYLRTLKILELILENLLIKLLERKNEKTQLSNERLRNYN